MRLGAGIIAVAFLVMGLGGALVIRHLGHSRFWVFHTQQVLTEVEAWRGAVRAAQDDQRGYLLDHEDRAIDRYRTDTRGAWSALDRIAALTQDNPTQQSRCLQARDLQRHLLARLDTGLPSPQPPSGRSPGVSPGRAIANDDDLDRLLDLAQAMAAEERDLLAQRLRRASWIGSIAYIVIALIAVSGALSSQIGAQLLITGLRRRQALQLALERTNADLECQVAERTAELTRSNAQLQAHGQHLSELNQRLAETGATLAATNEGLEAFSSSVSHDLRAPLRQIDGYIFRIERRLAGGSDPELTRQLAQVRLGVNRMDQLIRDLLALSSAARSPLQVSEVDLRALAQAVAEEIVPVEPGADFHVAALPPCQGDPGLLRQVLANLLSNAAKYSRAARDRRIAVRAVSDGSLAPQPGEPCAGEWPGGNPTVYVVEDHGSGFDAHAARGLFAPFQRFTTDSSVEGTGLGLAIVARILTRHRGCIWAWSQPGAGARFCFCIGTPSAASARFGRVG